VHRGIPAVLALGVHARVASERIGVARVKPANARRHCMRIAGRHEHTGVRRHDLGYGAGVDRDDAAPARHRFEQHQPERLLVARVHEAVDACQNASEFERRMQERQ
jgi:hypothetical protein